MIKKSTEIHLFILWQNARYKETEILDDMAKHFVILKKFAITWSPALVANNFTRFYGVNLPPKSGKEKECGTGEFLLCVVRDEQPIYAERVTSRGIETVNTNMFDAKQRYRSWTKGGHKVHATNNEKETNHDLTLLLGKNISDFLIENSMVESIIESIHRDIEGSNGWKSLEHLFYVLNNTISYVVLRNYENIPTEYDFSIHGDIDILTENKCNIAYIANAIPVYSEPYRVYHYVNIGSGMIPFDFRFIGDNYYDREWEKNILKQRVLSSKGFYIPDPVNQYYSLLYHAYVQKYDIAEDYPVKLSYFANSINEQYVNDKLISIAQLDKFMQENDYEYIQCEDITVGFNLNNLQLSRRYNRFEGKCIRSVKSTVNDIITKQPVSWISRVYKKENSYIKAGTPWLIDNEERSLLKVGDGIHFPKIIASGGDNKEHWIEISEMSGEELFHNKWGIRISHIRKYSLLILQLLEILYRNDIIHRDIHSGNIYVDSHDNVAILDFGFAIDFRQDKDFPCPWNLGMSHSPQYMYSDFYNLAGIFEYRWATMPYVAQFTQELKQIDWQHYPDKTFVEQQIARTKAALKKPFTPKDYLEYLLGKYKVRKYFHHPRKLLRRITPDFSKEKDYICKFSCRIARKIKKIFNL